MSTCLHVIKNVICPINEGIYMMGDMFVMDDALYYIHYRVFQTSGKTGEYAFAGVFLGGLAGFMVGSVIDSALSTGKGKKLPTQEGAKTLGESARNEDYGMAVDNRYSKRNGIRILKHDIDSINDEDEWCIVETSKPEHTRLPFIASNRWLRFDMSRDLYQWFHGNLQKPLKDIEGTNVGLGITDFISAFKSTSENRLSDDMVTRISSNQQYLDRFIEQLFRRSDSREAILAWLTKEALSLRDTIRASLRKSILRSKRRVKHGIVVIGVVAVSGFALSVYFAEMYIFYVCAILIAFGALIWVPTEVSTQIERRQRLKRLE